MQWYGDANDGDDEVSKNRIIPLWENKNNPDVFSYSQSSPVVNAEQEET